MMTVRLGGALLMAALAMSGCRQVAEESDLSRQAAATAAKCAELKNGVLADQVEGRSNPLRARLAKVSCKLAAETALEDSTARIRGMIEGETR
jgi:hypothetical protein